MKKTMKNLLAGLSALTMASTMIGMSVQGISVNVSKTPTLKISETCASPGQVAKVTVSIANNPGFAGFGATMNYDQGLQVIDEETGFVSMFNMNNIKGNTAISAANIDDIKEDGAIVDLYFKVPKNAKVGDVYTISWDNIKQLSSRNNVEYDNITIDGAIKVIEDKPTFGNDNINIDSTAAATPVQIFNINNYGNVIFASDNDDIVTVKDGNLIPKKKGSATIYALAGNIVLSCAVSVDGAVEVTGQKDVSELKGNVNLDDSVDAVDAASILKQYTQSMQNPDLETTSAMNFGDVNEDGSIDAVDAGTVLKYYTQKLNNPEITWDDLA